MKCEGRPTSHFTLHTSYLPLGELTALYIQQSHQQQGLGSQLVSAVATRLGQMGLNSLWVWVLADNPAGQFYAALGGQKVAQKELVIKGQLLRGCLKRSR